MCELVKALFEPELGWVAHKKEGNTMLMATRYTFKRDQSPDSVKALLAVFAERGAATGEIAHYVSADGRGGLIITEVDDAQEGYANALAYQQWLDLDSTPVLTIADAMPTIMAAFG